MIVKPTDISKKLFSLREKGVQRGISTGWETLNDYFTVKMGSTLYILAAPYSGKTEFVFSLLTNLSLKHNFKHLVFSPETGASQDIYAQIAHKYIGKPFYGDYKMSEQETIIAGQFIEKHFLILDPEFDGGVDDFYKQVDEAEKEYGKIHTTLIDPWNELAHNTAEFNNRDDRYLNEKLKFIRKNAAKNDRYNIICLHTRDPENTVKTVDVQGVKRSYYPAPTPHQAEMGQVWYRKAMGFISLWRPPEWLPSETGEPYSDNETRIIIQKAKPKGFAAPHITKGSLPLFYDWKTTRFYEKRDGQENFGAGEKREFNFSTEPPF